jgi:two-component system osmolarity sensor histidine kinase EnvZ
LWHPWKTLKYFLPKSLFARTLIILVSPLVIVQLVLGYIFFDRHTETILKVLSRTIAGDIALVKDLVERDNNLKRTKDFASRHLSLDVTLTPSHKLDRRGTMKKSWLYSFLDEALEEQINSPYFVRMDTDFIYVSVDTPKGLLTVTTQRKRLFSRTTPLVIIWSVSSSFLLIAVAALFLHNQIRPIRRLAKAAELFGKGDTTDTFKPEGASEVRQAGLAFLEMRNRLGRLLTERLEMLAGVSHDLRTPLTRLKLQLALMPPTASTQALHEDVDSMQRMVEGFLAYARGTMQEGTKPIELRLMVQEAIKNAAPLAINLTFNYKKNIYLNIKPTLINRCLTNILLNCKRYATQCDVTVEASGAHVCIMVDDNGPGIPLTERANVFKPFYRTDASRNLDEAGVGLGLTVANEAALAHGGYIDLDNSPLGGLRVRVTLPR